MIIKRELLFLTISYIIGILIGKFLNWTTSLIVVLFYLSICLFMIRRYNIVQYILIIISCLCLVIGCFNTLLKNEYNLDENSTNFTGTIIEINKIEVDRTSYIVRLQNGTYILLNLYTKSKLNVYDKINFYGDIIKPKGATNFGGFNYRDYLISKDIYAIVNATNEPTIIKNDNSNFFLIFCIKLKHNVINIINSTTSGVQKEIFKGIILGETSGFSDKMRQDFMNAGLTHLLAVSGSNVGLVIMCICSYLFFNYKKYCSKAFKSDICRCWTG